MDITLRSEFEQHKNVSLRRFAIELGLCYQYVLKLSKEPKVGVVYDESFVNYERVEKMLKDKKITLKSIDWAKIESEARVVEPLSQYEEFVIGSKFHFRNVDETFTVVMISYDYCVFVGDVTNKPRSMNAHTFMHQSPRIVK